MNININNLYDEINSKLDNLTKSIQIKDKNTIQEAVDNAKLQVNVWNKVSDAVVVFSDLKNSTDISFDNTEKTMSKLLEMLNKPFIEIHTKFGAEFIDIKGDGGIAIYSSENYLNALLASITVKTFYSRYVIEKTKKNYEFDFIVETGIANGNLLVKRVGTKKEENNFYVWSGETINKAALISKELKKKTTTNTIGVTQEIYNLLYNLKEKEYLIFSCECGSENNKKIKLWTEESLKGEKGRKYYYLRTSWCSKHGQEYFEKISNSNLLI